MENQKSHSVQKKVFGSRLFVWGGVVVLVLIVIGLGKAALRRHDITSQVTDLNKSVDALQSQNIELSGLLDYFKTKNYEELQARQNLGLKKAGETVVAIPESNAKDAEAFLNNSDSSAQEKLSNPRKWWNYFFSIQF
jgi:cell division protein FtsB